MTPCPYTIGADAPLALAKERMRELKIRHLPVLEGGALVGLLSERDVNWVEGFEVDAARTRVREAMSQSPYVVAPSAPLREVALTMAAGKYGSTIVRDSGSVVGVFTTIDAMRALADALR